MYTLTVDYGQILSSERVEIANYLVVLEGDKILLQFLLYFILQPQHLRDRMHASVSKPHRNRKGETKEEKGAVRGASGSACLSISHLRRSAWLQT